MVGLLTIRLLVQVHSIGYNLRSCTKDMTITTVKINPR